MDARRLTWALVLLAGGIGGCGSDGNAADGHGDVRDVGRDAECQEGEHRCASATVAETCTGGHWGSGIPCDESGQVCVDPYGCATCHPGMTRCDGNDSMVCSADGSAWTLSRTCDPAEGETCDTYTGICVNPCATAATARSNIGCEYWAVDLDNAENASDFAAWAQFAVVVANLSNEYQSEVVIDKDQAMPGEPHDLTEVDRATLDPGDLHIFDLPRWDVDGDNPAHVDSDPQTTLSRRVYHITATTPVVAYQFNTIDQAYSNAASVLLPTSALDTEYWGVVWPPANPGFLAHPNRDYVTIVAVADGTEVHVTPTYDIFAGVGEPDSGILPVDGIPAGTEATFTLDRFDVLNLENVAMLHMTDPLPDLTGTKVTSSVPVAVFMGNDLAVVGDKTLPDGSTECCCAEHMEQQVPPTGALGTKFVVSRSPPRSANTSVWLEYDYYRIFAVRDGTNVTTTAPGATSFTLDAGQWQEFSTQQGFIVTSDPYPVEVVQYIVSRDQTYDWRPTAGGDSDMVYIPPVEQRRSTYIFTTGQGFSENWAVISIPAGTSATIDGNDVATTCTTVYTDGTLDGVLYKAYHCPIEDGRHDVTSSDPDQPVGVMVFGYYNAGSYQYPAGSELNRIFFG